MNQDDVKMCDCAGCGAEIVGESSWPLLTSDERQRYHGRVAGRINGRPYCGLCLKPHFPTTGGSVTAGDPSPWLENAVRDLEEG